MAGRSAALAADPCVGRTRRAVMKGNRVLSFLQMGDERPSYRPAEIITERQAENGIASQNPEHIRLALIDGSRCLSSAWTLRTAPGLAAHEHSGVRWAAMFALDMARGGWLRLAGDDFFELVRLVEARAADDADASVRSMAAQTLVDLIGDV